MSVASAASACRSAPAGAHDNLNRMALSLSDRLDTSMPEWMSDSMSYCY
jgi:hypothetical protein